MDITVHPNNLRTDDEAPFHLSIIVQFSKFEYNYIISYKNAEIVLGKFKELVNVYGKPNSLHTENGKEFHNNLFNKYCDENNIKHLYGLLYDPQSKGCIEAYNK